MFVEAQILCIYFFFGIKTQYRITNGDNGLNLCKYFNKKDVKNIDLYV